MKKIIRSLVLCLALAVPVATVPLTGCKSPNKTAYRTVGTVQISADAAMTAWGAYVKQFRPGVAAETKVKAAYEKYQSTMIVVAISGKALAEADNKDSRHKLDIALAAAASALSDLTQLIQSLGVKVKP